MIAGVLLCLVGLLFIVLAISPTMTIVHTAVAGIGFVIIGLGAVCWQLARIRSKLAVAPETAPKVKYDPVLHRD